MRFCKTLVFRAAALSLLPGQIALGLPAPALARQETTSKSAPAIRGSANRNLPAVRPPTLEPEFSTSPSLQEIFRARVFRDPLVPAGGTPTVEENAHLAAAILAYARATDREDFSAFAEFLKANPTSSWRASVLANLGVAYRATGYFTRALAADEEAWELAKEASDSSGRAVAHIALGELMDLRARLGHLDELTTLFEEIRGRDLTGTVTSKVESARQAVLVMKTKPEYAYRCGPLAVGHLLSLGGESLAQRKKVNELLSTSQGTSLAQVQGLAQAVGLDGVAGFRTDSRAPLVTPVVVHWRAGHFAALVREEGGRYLLEDPTFGTATWVSRQALDDETSGYFLLTSGVLPSGWRPVGTEEAASVWGKGYPSYSNTQNQTPSDGTSGGDSGPPCGMAAYRFHSMLASLRIEDLPCGYESARGAAVRFNPTYLQREEFLPSIPYFSNLGPKWTFGWLSFIEDQPSQEQQTLNLFVRGGGQESYLYDSGSLFGPNGRSNAWIVRTSSSPIRYELRRPDGSVDVYSQPESLYSVTRRVLLTQSIDPQGNAVRFVYDDLLRLVAVSDAVGQVTTLGYGLGSDPLKITDVTDPFGRSARLSYDSNGRLIKITDVLNLSSEFTYGAADFVTAMKTPYGTTKFSTSEDQEETTLMDPVTQTLVTFINSSRFIEATDPLGGKERLEFWNHSPYGFSNTEPSELVPPGFNWDNYLLASGLSMFWSKQAMARKPGDPEAAEVTNWAHTFHYGPNVATALVVKRPLEESRLWYFRAGQAQISEHRSLGTGSALPLRVGRILDDGSAQVVHFEYNKAGKLLKAIDPVGRETVYVYGTANVSDPDPGNGWGLDLLQVKQKNAAAGYEVLASYTYNGQHLPLTVTDAAGQAMIYTYTPAGQLATVVTPPRNGPDGQPLTQAQRMTTFEYFPDSDLFGPGKLKKITGPAVTPAPPSVTLAYDNYGRVKTVTDQEGNFQLFTYDAMDRIVRVAYPDNTFEEVAHNRLDAERFRDRLGRWTAIFHDALRRPTAIRNPLGRSTLLDWCDCGSLDKVVDALGNATRWERDIQGRVVKETRADGRTAVFTYEQRTSRLKQVKDALGQTTTYSYVVDDNVNGVTHGGATNPTPNVTLTFDPQYDRLASISDGTGTTSYSYHPVTASPFTPGAGRLASVDGPYAGDTLSYAYDELGRITTRGLSGFSSTLSYDALGRIASLASPVGTFAYSAYLNATAKPLTLSYPNGQTTSYAYLPVTADQRLQQIKHQMPGGGPLLSQFDYSYDAVGNIKTWTQQYGVAAPKVYDLSYDAVDQLVSATLKTTGVPPTVLKRYAFGYDGVGNRTTEQVDDGVMAGTFNSLNQLVSRQAGGALRFAGTLNEAATVTVQGQPALVAPDNSFQGTAPVVSGPNTVTVVATDPANHARTNTYSVTVAGTPTSYTYDPSGNLTGDGTRTFEWDGRNRLVRVTSEGPEVARFTYDGFGRRATKVAGGVTTTFVYDGDDIIEERLSTGTTYRYVHGPGIDQPWARRDGAGTVTYYVADHLGSIVQTTDAAGQVTLTREYDPWGNLTSGASTSGYAFTGREWDPETSLYYYRARYYDPKIGRFISEDPIGLRGGLNLYSYVDNRPLTWYDPTGLAGQRPPVGPDGKPLPPPIAPPADKQGQPNKWVPRPGTEDRPTKWVPERPVPSPKGGQPGASWDEDGHWDIDDGQGKRKRYLPDGTETEHKRPDAKPDSERNLYDAPPWILIPLIILTIPLWPARMAPMQPAIMCPAVPAQPGDAD